MVNLMKLANQACNAVPDVSVGDLSMTSGGTVHEVTLYYKGYERPIRFLYEDLQTQTQEWLLDDLIGQFEKFKVDVDELFSEDNSSV